jgi:hypothetical protein
MRSRSYLISSASDANLLLFPRLDTLSYFYVALLPKLCGQDFVHNMLAMRFLQMQEYDIITVIEER